MSEKIKVILVEDHQVVRHGLRLLIDSQPDILVIGEASDGKEALELLAKLDPDVIVFDISMPVMNGLELIKELKARGSTLHLLTLTANEDPAYIQHMVRLGVTGYLFKRSASHELILAIRAVARGERYLDPSIVHDLVDGLFLTGLAASTVPAGGGLTDREEEVVRYLAKGYTNKEIAIQLDISVKTVDTHKARAMLKLGLRSRAEIVRFALARGWLSSA